MKAVFAIALLSGCGRDVKLDLPSIERVEAPSPALRQGAGPGVSGGCNGMARDAMVACLVGAINAAMGCDRLVFVGETASRLNDKRTGKDMDLHFYSVSDWPYGDHTAGEEVDEHDGVIDIYVLDNVGGGLQDKASILLHELGHAFGLRYPDNVDDPQHSAVRGDMMFYVSPFTVTEEELNGLTQQLNAQRLACE